ncbi:MAG: 7-carboxy-7-deazaguanine synthase QueE, partial [Gammaproteobacteria bacterium]|nr:7-carboxy-7-deazaguanine synthase QueE [Gammaproteobacteria bacterium]
MSIQTEPDIQTRLKIAEIFYSLQGEARNVGLPTVFIRLTGCPLRCAYCDTAYAFSGGEWMEVDDIIAQA